MIIANIITVVVIFVFFLVGVFATVSISTNAKPIRYTMYNELDCPGVDVCPTYIDDNIPQVTKLIDKYDTNTARFCMDLISRIQLNKTDVPNITKHGEFISTLNTDNIFCVVWYTDNVIWIAFRGTWNLYEWINNFKIQQVSYETGRREFKNLPKFMYNNKDILVHKGFIKIYNELRSKIFVIINELMRDGIRICVTGHSLGGAVATILGLDLKTSGYDAQVYTIGSPRVGNPELRDEIVRSDLPHYRIVNTEDIIPQMPLPISPNFSNHADPFFYIHNGTEYTFSDYKKSISTNHAVVTYINNINNIEN